MAKSKSGGKTAGQKRGAGGRFLPGCSAGPGRGNAANGRKKAEYESVFMAKCSIEDWAVIVERAVTDARNGSWRAREWLAKHLLPDLSAAVGPESARAEVIAGLRELMASEEGSALALQHLREKCAELRESN